MKNDLDLDWDRIEKEGSKPYPVDYKVILALRAFYYQLCINLDKKYCSRDDYDQHTSWQSQQRIAEWHRLMEHSHGMNGEVVFPTDDSCCGAEKVPETEYVCTCLCMKCGKLRIKDGGEKNGKR